MTLFRHFFVRNIADRVRDSLWLAGCIAVLGYCAWHLVDGRNGLRTWQRYTDMLPQVEREAAAARAHRQMLEHHVELLDPAHPDADYVDELARRRLNKVRPGDYMLELPNAEPVEPDAPR